MKTTVEIYLKTRDLFYPSDKELYPVAKKKDYFLILLFNNRRATYKWDLTTDVKSYNLSLHDTIGGNVSKLPNHVVTLSLLNIEDLYAYLEATYPDVDSVKNTHPELFI